MYYVLCVMACIGEVTWMNNAKTCYMATKYVRGTKIVVVRLARPVLN